jgi:hypothetical protein
MLDELLPILIDVVLDLKAAIPQAMRAASPSLFGKLADKTRDITQRHINIPFDRVYGYWKRVLKSSGLPGDERREDIASSLYAFLFRSQPFFKADDADTLLARWSDRLGTFPSKSSRAFLLLAWFLPPSEFVRFEYLSARGIKSPVDLISESFELFSYGIWSRFANRLLLPVQPPQMNCRFVIPPLDSKIIPEFPSTFEEFQRKEFKLLYRGSRDGFQSADFHRTCDGHKPTASLISSKNGFIFGGYTPLAWNSTATWTSDEKVKSFLFTIKNPHSLPPRTFPLNREVRANAIYNHSSYGPFFGTGHDLCIQNQCNAFTSNSTNLGQTYTNDSGIPGNTVLAGVANFTVEEIEVFEMSQP